MNVIHLTAATHPVASPVNDNTPWVGPGLTGFIIVVIIGLATWMLGRSMTRQLRKLDAGYAERRQSEVPEEERVAAPAAASTPSRDPN